MNQTSRQYLGSLSSEQVMQDSQNLDQLDGFGIARLMNAADATVHEAVKQALPAIGRAIEEIAKRLQSGGRLVYVGAGTSGRLGVLDASECPPTFGVSPDLVTGIIAGGDLALRLAAEGAEDNDFMGQKDLEDFGLTAQDAVVAISASGYAPYCCAALRYARQTGALAIGLSCNSNTRLSREADLAIETHTGPEVLMGSTRLKAGTATKMVLNMLSTGAMVRTGRVYRNLMVDMAATNQKLADRSLRIIGHATGLSPREAEPLLRRAEGRVKTAIVMHLAQADKAQAEEALKKSGGWVARALEELGI
ncbi:MAG: N-acetylmuramic acid 6-phosphate etherase [Bacillota bacterium]|nr:N-acetylmuramic acid 6-phosphate etherase [Bacillota bacterium]